MTKKFISNVSFNGGIQVPTGAGANKALLSDASGNLTLQALTAAIVGLGNVNNTSDANKPISTAVQTALDLKQPYLGIAQYSLAARAASGTGAPDTFVNYGSGPGAYLIVQHDGNGQAQWGTPTDPAHTATKGYVDAAIAGVSGGGGGSGVSGFVVSSTAPADHTVIWADTSDPGLGLNNKNFDGGDAASKYGGSFPVDGGTA